MAAVAGVQDAKTGKSADAPALVEKLDKQYEAYLGLLHEYTEARTRLTKLMSDGFFCLAQANFATQNRMRYGQDSYDQRMQASKVITIGETESDGFVFDITDVAHGEAIAAEAEDEEDPAASQVLEEAPEAEDGADKTPAKKGNLDPLRWFGVLVPHQLRSSQKHFTDAAIVIVQELATLNSRMKAGEIEIRRTKKHLGKLS